MTTGRAAAAVVLVCAIGLVAGGCGGSRGDTSAEQPTTTAGPPLPLTSIPDNAQTGPNPPPINDFDVPATVSCPLGQPTNVKVSYTTENPMTVTFLVDEQQVEGYPPKSGSFDLPVPCDGKAHVIVMFAVAADTSTRTRSRTTQTGV